MYFACATVHGPTKKSFADVNCALTQKHQLFLPAHLLERGGEAVPMPDSGSSRSTKPTGESDSESRELLCCGEHEEEELVDLLSSSSSVCSSNEEVDTQVKLELRESGGEVCVPVSTMASGFMAVNSVCCATHRWGE